MINDKIIKQKDIKIYNLKQKIQNLEINISYNQRENKFKDNEINELRKEISNLKNIIYEKDFEICNLEDNMWCHLIFTMQII